MTPFQSICDALTFVQNSFSPDYDWGEQASPEGFAEFLYWNTDQSFDFQDYGSDLSAYLKQAGQDPSDHGIGR